MEWFGPHQSVRRPTPGFQAGPGGFRAAALAPLDGSDFHAYRRAWATARKHLPPKDVAQAGGWKSTDTLLRSYTQVDDKTIFAVVSETRKLRAGRG